MSNNIQHFKEDDEIYLPFYKSDQLSQQNQKIIELLPQTQLSSQDRNTWEVQFNNLIKQFYQPPIVVICKMNKSRKFSQQFIQNLWQQKQILQDKNVLKFSGRLFLKYSKKLGNTKNQKQRLKQIKETLKQCCKGDRGKINLKFFIKIFNQSKYQSDNRRIFYKILNDVDNLNKQLHGNGNVKKKIDYLYGCKLLSLRCRSGTLCERTPTR